MTPGGRDARPSVGLHRFAILTAIGTFFVLIAGAAVTSTGSGLSVPDWPLSYGKFFPEMQGGVFYEHGHRMIAGTVALLLFALTIWTWRTEHRSWVRFLITFAFVLVIGQAILGGLTVLLLLPASISVAHASTAMLLFALVVTFAAVTSPKWASATGSAEHRASRLAVFASGVTALVYLQIVVGAIMRHIGAGLACPDFPLCHGELVPPLNSFYMAVHFYHRVGGVLVTLAVWALALAAHRWVPQEKGIRNLMFLAAGGVLFQFGLGVASIWTRLDPLVTVLHHAGGATLLALTTLIALWSFRLAHNDREDVVRSEPEAAEAGASAR